jgi:hypothetical protein
MENFAGVVNKNPASYNKDATFYPIDLEDCPGFYDLKDCNPGNSASCRECSRLEEKNNK